MSARRRIDVSLTAEDQQILQRIGARQERQYRRADREDAELARMRLSRAGCGIANVVARGIRAAVQS
jgi:hypothetical protein